MEPRSSPQKAAPINKNKPSSLLFFKPTCYLSRHQKLKCARKCILLLTVTFLLIIGILVPIVLAKHYKQGLGSTDQLKDTIGIVAQNLIAYPFSDAILATKCPSGYSRLGLGKWPGTVRFCYNDDDDEISKSYLFCTQASTYDRIN